MGLFNRGSKDTEEEPEPYVPRSQLPPGTGWGRGDRPRPGQTRLGGGPPPVGGDGRRRDSRRGDGRDRGPGRDGEEAPKDSDSKESKSSMKSSALGLLRDVMIALIIMLIIIGSMWAYTKNWPPMVVVESGSMMHGDRSEVGVIDTGDLVLVKKVEKRSEITTYFQGKKEGYEAYGNYGDVIIFKKNGGADTPVIHRAILWLVFNETATNADPQLPTVGHFDIPELGLYDKTGNILIDSNFRSYADGEGNGQLTLQLGTIYSGMSAEPHSGYITKGDHNKIDTIDQYNSIELSSPVKFSWIIGKAKGELPWFGLIKLYFSGSLSDKDPAPPNSVNNLIITIALLIVIPIVLDIAYTMYIKRKKARKGGEEEDEEEDKGPPDKPGDEQRGRGGIFRPGDRDRPPDGKQDPDDQEGPPEGKRGFFGRK